MGTDTIGIMILILQKLLKTLITLAKASIPLRVNLAKQEQPCTPAVAVAAATGRTAELLPLALAVLAVAGKALPTTPQPLPVRPTQAAVVAAVISVLQAVIAVLPALAALVS